LGILELFWLRYRILVSGGGEPCTIALSLTREGKYYHLRISDNGIGITGRMEVAPINSPGLHLIMLHRNAPDTWNH
jgi:two-component sensor histidine kinase